MKRSGLGVGVFFNLSVQNCQGAGIGGLSVAFLFTLYSEERAVVTAFPWDALGGTDPALL